MTTTRRLAFSTAFLGGLALAASAAFAADANPRVELDTTAGKIVIELDAEKAPVSVENFLKYVDDGFYSNLIFHRVIKGFMIQGGGFDDKLAERDESNGVRAPIKNESGNGLSNTRGTIAMARTRDPDSATCQFYINHGDNLFLDKGRYAVFGKVVEGMDVVDAIANSQTTTRSTPRGPLDDVPVKTITIKSAKRVKS